MTFDRRITPARPEVAAAHLRGQVEAARFAEGRRHAVVVPVVPLRPEPREDRGIDTQLLFGETLMIYESDAEGWSWGQADRDGYVGWVPGAALGPPDPGPVTHKVAALRSFVFPGPSIKLPTDLALPFGARLRVEALEGAFARVGAGFVWAGHLREVDGIEADAVAVAERFVGVPYLWGGCSSLGLDCSGLVQLALGAAGIAAPRDTDLQEAALGSPVPTGAPLLRGDLVFWRGHVGMMRDGAELLHANGHTMTVAAEPLASACRRIEDAGGGPVTSIRRL